MCSANPLVTEGRMMHSPAIHFKGKVFAFFSREENMVFKLGKDYPFDQLEMKLPEFSPFKSKKPLTGWYEAGIEHIAFWKELSYIALRLAKEKLRA